MIGWSDCVKQIACEGKIWKLRTFTNVSLVLAATISSRVSIGRC
jgi:hypothetical protein